MSAKRTGRQNMIILVVLLAAQLFLMSGSVRGAKGAATLERILMRASSPVVSLAELVGGTVGGTGRTLRELLVARARNQVLETRIRRMTGELRYYREAERENRRLRRMLEMKETLAPKSIVASVVISRTRGPSRMIVVDRGTRAGVRKDQPVMAWGGAVGRVVTADSAYSKVLLLTDPSSGVAGLVQHSRAQGIVFGTEGPGLEMRFVPRFSDVSHGDRVVTSGLAGIFPRGIGVGRVTSIRQAADGTQTIELEPELDYGSLEEVLIVLKTAEGGPLPHPAAEASDLNALRALLGLVAALGLQVTLARIWPDTGRFVSLLLVLVVTYGVSGSQRSAIFMGCLAGLLNDVWLQAGAFGISGFKWTLLGWLLGSVNMRLDLGHTPGRFGAGVALVLGDSMLNGVLARLLDQPNEPRGVWILLLQALLTGLLAAIIGSMVDRSRATGPHVGASGWRGAG